MPAEGRSDPRPEILYVIGQLDVGGTETHLAAVAPALARLGWRVSVFSLRGEGPVERQLVEAGVDVISRKNARRKSGGGRLWRGLLFGCTAYQLFRALRSRRPAVVHFFLPAAYLVGAPVAALAGAPIRVMSRRSLNAYQASYPFASTLEKLLHRGMSAVLGNSLSVVRQLRDDEGVPAETLGLIYNGLETSRFASTSRNEARAALHMAPDELVLVTVANLIPYKGHSDILAALVRVKSKLPARWRMLMVGRDDGIGLQLGKLANEYGLGAYVEWLGSRSDVPLLLAASDIGLLCSHEEGFSNALLEGMAAGLPMVATDVGGNAEAVRHGESGIIVPPRDVERLADALQQLAQDASLRSRLGAAARARVTREFSLDRCVESYDELYRGLSAGKRPAELFHVKVEGRP